MIHSFHRLSVLTPALFVLAACHGEQFAGWQQERFEPTAVTQSLAKSVIIGQTSESQNQHLLGINFEQGSNAAGHFRIDAVKVNSQIVSASDIVIPSQSLLEVTVSYTPMNLLTTSADYGGWVTGEEGRFNPRPVGAADADKSQTAIHRAILQAVYD